MSTVKDVLVEKSENYRRSAFRQFRQSGYEDESEMNGHRMMKTELK